MSKDKDKFGLTPDDKAIWDEYTRDIRKEEVEEEDFESLLEEKQVSIETDELPIAHENTSEDVEFETSAIAKPHKVVTFERSSEIDKRTFDRLRRGKIPIEGRLDLHGMNQSEARAALVKFIVSGYAVKRRCLIVITGKGKSKSTSKDWLSPSKGILKERVPDWLQEIPCKELVLKYTHAIAKDGGSGALYVYLRRHR